LLLLAREFSACFPPPLCRRYTAINHIVVSSSIE
jgi:hypothetical protein